MLSIAYLGRGGQGIVFAATLTANALFEKGYYVVQLQNYGASVRGGAVLAYVVAGEDRVENPFVEEFDLMIVLHEEGLERWRWLAEKARRLVLDEKLVKTVVPGATRIPLSTLAEEEGVYQALNVVAVGLAVSLLGLEGLDPIIEEVLRRKNYSVNWRAYLLGKRIASTL